jgi:hypothetical protein
VVEVVPHLGDSASILKIAFDKMLLKNGSDMALPANIKTLGFADQFDPATPTRNRSTKWAAVAESASGHRRKELSVRAAVNRAYFQETQCET